MRTVLLVEVQMLAAVALGLYPIGAMAQSERAAAVALFDEGQRLMAQGKYPEACPKLAESYRLDPQLGALLHMADCYEKAGQLASAWTAFRDAAELADRRADERSLTAKQRADTLEHRLSRLTISVPEPSNVPGLVVSRDGIVVNATLWGVAVPVDKGSHVITATAPGKEPWRQIVEVGAEKQGLSVAVPLLADTAPTATPTATRAPESPEPGSTGTVPEWVKPVGWAAVGVGAVGVGVGIALQIRRSSKIDDRDAICPSSVNCTQQDQTDIHRLTDEARSAGKLSVVGLVAGGVLAAGGLTLLFASPSLFSTNRTRFQPAVGVGFQGVSVTHVW